MMIITATEEHLVAIGRLRYAVYVEEMRRDEPEADHSARVLLDPTDRDSIVLAGMDANGHAVGTVRWQPMEHVSDFDRRFHRFNDLPYDLQSASSLTSRFIVAATHRKSSLATRLMNAAFESAYQKNRLVNMINCNPPLDGFFAKFGFVHIGDREWHPVYGDVQLMMLPMADVEWFSAMGSPFARFVDRIGRDADAAMRTRAWFESMGIRYWQEMK